MPEKESGGESKPGIGCTMFFALFFSVPLVSAFVEICADCGARTVVVLLPFMSGVVFFVTRYYSPGFLLSPDKYIHKRLIVLSLFLYLFYQIPSGYFLPWDSIEAGTVALLRGCTPAYRVGMLLRGVVSPDLSFFVFTFLYLLLSSILYGTVIYIFLCIIKKIYENYIVARTQQQ